MRISCNGGHTPTAPGAHGYLDELTEDRLIKDALIEELRARGHVVTDSTSPDSYDQNADLAQQCTAANESGAELAVSIHLNSGGGTGPEVWYWQGSKAGAVCASKIADALASCLGLRNRGAKTGVAYYWLKHTTMTAVIVEVCFVDTEQDAEAYRAAGYRKVAAAIADAISGTNNGVMAGGAEQPEPEQPEQPETSGKLDVDGWWGPQTTKRLQEFFNITADGVISSQAASYAASNPGLVGGWDWVDDPQGSPTIRAIQHRVGAEPDGIFGPVTCVAMQLHFGTPADGEVWGPSMMVKALQEALNSGRF